VGQPEFRNILRSPSSTSSASASSRRAITPLDADGRATVEHRHVGELPPCRTGSPCTRQGRHPRRINLLFDRMLPPGTRQRREFDAAMVEWRPRSRRDDGAPGRAGLAPVTQLPWSGARRQAVRADRDIQQIKASLDRVESENRSALGTFRQFLDWLRADEGQPKKRA
jgi:hypothetical protein